MKKFISNTMCLIGIIGVALMIYFIVNYGATSMRRVDADAYHWRISWADRR